MFNFTILNKTWQIERLRTLKVFKAVNVFICQLFFALSQKKTKKAETNLVTSQEYLNDVFNG